MRKDQDHIGVFFVLTLFVGETFCLSKSATFDHPIHMLIDSHMKQHGKQRTGSASGNENEGPSISNEQKYVPLDINDVIAHWKRLHSTPNQQSVLKTLMELRTRGCEPLPTF